MEQCIFMSRSQQEASKQPQLRAGRCSSIAGDAAHRGRGRGWPTEAIGDYVMKKERLAVDCPLVVLRPGLWSEANYESRAKLAVSPPRLCRAMAKIHKQASSRLNCVLLSRCHWLANDCKSAIMSIDGRRGEMDNNPMQCFFFLLYLGKPSLMLMYNIVVCVNVIEQCSRYMGSMHASHGGDGQRAVAWTGWTTCKTYSMAV